ncbi:MAG: hypothetical protein GOMPHAMPRED_001664 [Gomphillus americanus]|uniref:Enoyl reductase (ER) domain-containing protein n=1 Tax=Gomphillus americanus TaxID=1940652 RepID=A0A8H3F6H2_9LECA|nr:MAG: hypothetical protein GOMPHAMPRED_001664 [Gomphillus americanus]
MSNLPLSMRAAQYTTASSGIDKSIRINQVPLPDKLPEGHTLVKVAYASINPADYKIPESIFHYAFSKPATPGMDWSGTIVKTTRKDLVLGQRVFGNIGPTRHGALAEYIVVGAGCVPLPDSVPFDQAACVGVAGLTAFQSIVPYSPRSVFINGGSGGTGTFGIQVAKTCGAHVVTSCSTSNVQLCKDLGADEVIDYRSQDLMAELRKHEFDHVVDNVFNSASLYWYAHEYLKARGVYLTIAGSPSLSDAWEFAKVLLLPGFLGGGKRQFKFILADVNQKDLVAVAEWMAQGKIKAHIDETFDLAEIADAFAKLKLGRTRGKIVIKIAEST